MVALTRYDCEDLVIQLHNIARELEQHKGYWVFGNDLRDFADRLSRVNKSNNIRLSEQEQFVYDYICATNGMPLEDLRG